MIKIEFGSLQFPSKLMSRLQAQVTETEEAVTELAYQIKYEIAWDAWWTAFIKGIDKKTIVKETHYTQSDWKGDDRGRLRDYVSIFPSKVYPAYTDYCKRLGIQCLSLSEVVEILMDHPNYMENYGMAEDEDGMFFMYPFEDRDIQVPGFFPARGFYEDSGGELPT